MRDGGWSVKQCWMSNLHPARVGCRRTRGTGAAGEFSMAERESIVMLDGRCRIERGIVLWLGVATDLQIVHARCFVKTFRRSQTQTTTNLPTQEEHLMTFKLPELPYPFDALEPHIDARTMEIHHDKHHKGYTDKLNAAIEGTEWADKDIAEILRNLGDLPADKQTAVRNNGGGYFNHSLFWKVLSPDGGGKPSGELATAIDSAFGSFDDFKSQFEEAAKTRFGSGWAWLCVNPDGKLHVCSTANQDTTLMPEKFGGMGAAHSPILGLDVWEHAYYLKYQNKRPDYVGAFWNVVNWDQVAENFATAGKAAAV